MYTFVEQEQRHGLKRPPDQERQRTVQERRETRTDARHVGGICEWIRKTLKQNTD